MFVLMDWLFLLSSKCSALDIRKANNVVRWAEGPTRRQSNFRQLLLPCGGGLDTTLVHAKQHRQQQLKHLLSDWLAGSTYFGQDLHLLANGDDKTAARHHWRSQSFPTARIGIQNLLLVSLSLCWLKWKETVQTPGNFNLLSARPLVPTSSVTGRWENLSVYFE